MPRIALLAGSKIAIVNAGDDAVILAPPPPREPVADVAAAVRDSLRFPLGGDPLEALVSRGGRATLVIEPPAQPVPQTPVDPRPAAIAAALGELERVGVRSVDTTILVAGGLARRTARRDVDQLVPPELARRFRGAVEVHDAESPELVPVDGDGLRDIRVHPALLDTDLVLTLSAAETVLHGGTGLLVGAADAATIRAAGAYSLLETAASRGWQIGVALERALARRVSIIGTSLVLTLPRLTGMLQGYPYEEESVERLVRSPVRHVFGALPGAVRRRALRAVPASRGVSAAFSGPPSVAHAEALLRGTEERARSLGEPLDAICLGVPGTTPYLPRERPNPLLAAYLGLGLALRLWRDAFPVVDGGTAILVHPFERRFAHPSQQPYRNFFRAMRAGSARELDLTQRGRACGGGRPEGDRRLSRRTDPSSAAALRRLERVRAGARAARHRARRRVPRPRRGARARPRPDARRRRRDPDGAGPHRPPAADRVRARAAVLPAAGAHMTFRCAELSLSLDEPLEGTAPVAERWELVEREKPWGRDHGLQAEGAKVLLVKRVGGAAPRGIRTWSERQYLVCTNGARDPCCAIRGPAVAAALERVRPGQVYECSHLGGHRFAANVLVLPDGLCFGRLDSRTAVALVEELEAGRLPLDHLRGRTALGPEQQAAEILLRRELGLTGLGDLRPVGVSGSERQARFARADGREVVAHLHAERLPPQRVSCRDDKVEAATRWTLLSVESS